MASICKGCTFNNNGWCRARKTNQGLKDLISCEYKKTDNMVALESYLQQKLFELEFDNTAYNRGLVKGLEIAVQIMKK
ncbi:hypothetical protein [Clostridium thermarum]|uniref:hypothetical protein n=1 Tax=Clostridium thermarum TaxID=1716543 RepID=UPI00111E0C88|nr:hypothetical protein [Clostridium thermarum]